MRRVRNVMLLIAVALVVLALALAGGTYALLVALGWGLPE